MHDCKMVYFINIFFGLYYIKLNQQNKRWNLILNRSNFSISHDNKSKVSYSTDVDRNSG